MKRTHRWWGLAVCLAFGCGTAAAQVAPAARVTRYQVTDIGNLGGGQQTNGYALNSVGQATGLSMPPSGTSCAFLYRDGVMIPLNGLAKGSSINSLGQIAGLAGNHAAVYGGGTTTDLGTLGGALSGANGINDAGQVTGEAQTPDGHTHAFLYSGGAMLNIGFPGEQMSIAYGINGAGQVTGWSTPSGDNYQRPFVYSGGVSTLLDTQGRPGIGTAINDLGQVAGTFGNPDATQQAFLYSGGQVTLIGDANASALALNNAGDVVGQFGSHRGWNAFLFHAGVFMDLNRLLDPASALVWNLTSATAINDAGQILVLACKRGQCGRPPYDVYTLLLTPMPR